MSRVTDEALVGMKQYVVVPGFVGDRYFGVAELIRLYGVKAFECSALEPPLYMKGNSYKHAPGLIYLRPQADGVYSVKRERAHRSPA